MKNPFYSFNKNSTDVTSDQKNRITNKEKMDPESITGLENFRRLREKKELKKRTHTKLAKGNGFFQHHFETESSLCPFDVIESKTKEKQLSLKTHPDSVAVAFQTCVICAGSLNRLQEVPNVSIHMDLPTAFN